MDNEQSTFQTPDGGAKIGPILENARKEKGLSLEEVEHATKIRKRYLTGLEREDYGVLPDAVYAQGFLKTYANYLGLDGEALARELRDRRRPRRERAITYGPPKTSEFDRPLIHPGELAKTRRGRGVSGTTILTLLVALLTLTAVVGTLYYVGRGVQTSGPNPQPSQPSEEEAANGPKRGADSGQAPAKEASQERDASGNSRGAGGSDQKAASEPQPNSLRVEVSVEGSPSWLSILADGNLAYEQIAQPGFSQAFEARREISIRTGNAGAVGVQVNGQDVGKLGESGEVLTKRWTLKTAS